MIKITKAYPFSYTLFEGAGLIDECNRVKDMSYLHSYLSIPKECRYQSYDVFKRAEIGAYGNEFIEINAKIIESYKHIF